MSTKLVNAGVPALIGGLCLGTAFAGYILALEYTTVANAMFLLASAPFFAALAGRFLLGEGIASYTWVAMLVAAVGIAIMAGDELSLGKGLGEGFGLIAALGFAGLTVSLRARPQTDKLITIQTMMGPAITSVSDKRVNSTACKYFAPAVKSTNPRPI